jgi:protein TonB
MVTLTSQGRFSIALVTAITLHGVVLTYLSGMHMSEPQKPRIMVGMLIKTPVKKPTEPKVQVPPPPAPKVAPPEPPAQQPLEQPALPEPKPQVVRTKPAVPKKSVPSVKPVKEAHPQKSVAPVVQTASVNSTESVSSKVAESSPIDEVLPPQFHADYLHNPQPRYPLMSRKRREEGEVLLRVRVDAQGHPQTVQVHTSSGHSRLDRAASSAVREWRFVPARQAGLNVAAWVIVPIQFNMEK